MTIFQFHKGTIRTQFPIHTPSAVQYFNSIKVQLERSLSIRVRIILIFQFHKGTIRTSYPYKIGSTNSNFNSIKVQLELLTIDCLSIPMLFQFHKGTIRTDASTQPWKLNPLFQFHKGTIRTLNLAICSHFPKISIP